MTKKYLKQSTEGFLFETPAPDWEEKWDGMPEYMQEDLMPWQTIYVHFKNIQDREEFVKLVGQKITGQTKSIWYPRLDVNVVADKRYKLDSGQLEINPRYPVYVISKGRWDSRLTVKALETIKVPYHVVIEPQEYDNYAEVIDPDNILVLPFSNLGQGSIPARNWVWEHSISIGAERHWIMDDNIRDFYRKNNNQKVPVATGAIFAAAEDFVDRYTNVAISGLQYFMFNPNKMLKPPFTLNTRVYSCILIKNDIPYRWRGRYNEDTDLSIRALKDGWCTVLFNAFMANKMATMTMKGGNTEELYLIDDGRLKMAESLKEQHPDITTIVQKWGRWQHSVDYSKFRKNKLILKPNAEIRKGTNNYNMELMMLDEKIK
jgi:hypothetical protein